MRIWIVSAAAAVACGVLGYRVFALERAIDELSARVGGEDAQPAASGKVPAVDQSARVAALEGQLARLRGRLAELDEQAKSKVDIEDLDESISEDRILSVVSGEAERIRDVQLDFHRDRWVELRNKELTRFVKGQKLDPMQEQRLRGLLRAETERIAELLKSKVALEDPAQAAIDWSAILRETDRSATSLLADETAADAWMQWRELERKLLWPWLPEAE